MRCKREAAAVGTRLQLRLARGGSLLSGACTHTHQQEFNRSKEVVSASAKYDEKSVVITPLQYAGSIAV